MRLVEFSLAHRIPVACFSCHKINKISISWLNYNRKQEILLKNLPQNQSNLKANGIYSCTGIYFFKSAISQYNTYFCFLTAFSRVCLILQKTTKSATKCCPFYSGFPYTAHRLLIDIALYLSNISNCNFKKCLYR